MPECLLILVLAIAVFAVLFSSRVSGWCQWILQVIDQGSQLASVQVARCMKDSVIWYQKNLAPLDMCSEMRWREALPPNIWNAWKRVHNLPWWLLRCKLELANYSLVKDLGWKYRSRHVKTELQVSVLCPAFRVQSRSLGRRKGNWLKFYISCWIFCRWGGLTD